MKKIVGILFLIAFTLSVSAQVTTPRFGTAKNQDNTGRVTTNAYTTPTWTGTVSVNANASYSTIKPAVFSGTVSVTVNAVVTNAHVCDKLELLLSSGSATSATITFGTNFKPKTATTVLSSSKKTVVSFVFDGVAWIEEYRDENL